MSREREERLSRNFAVLKPLAILCVVVAHFLSAALPILWVPAAFGLHIFAYSSAYFTARKYRDRFGLRAYWRQKLYRLGIDLMVINVFLGTLFIIEGKRGIVSWHTAVNLVGLNGFLNWFRIPNASPFGAGMWFFTLLLLFYGIYPVLNALLKSTTALGLFFAGAVGALYWLNLNVAYGHTLWLTAGGFVFGFVVAKTGFSLPRNVCIGAMLALGAGLGFLYVSKSTAVPTVILLFPLFCFSVLLIEHLHFESAPVARLSRYVFPVYLIHMYLFVKITGNDYLNAAISLLIVAPAAVLLAKVSEKTREVLLTAPEQHSGAVPTLGREK
ncbi:MAG: acyltransferase [Nitrospirota bacterium]